MQLRFSDARWRLLSGWPIQAAMLVVIIGAQVLGLVVIKATFAALALWALTGPRRAIQALSIVWILGLLNPDLLPVGDRLNLQRDTTILLLKWVVLAGAATSCVAPVVLRRQALPATVVWFSAFVAVAALASMATSALPDVSLSKLAAFWLGMVTVLVGFRITAHEAREHHEWFVALAAALVVLSLPLLLVPKTFRAIDGLFRGLFAHPQYTGLVFASIVAWFAGRWFTEGKASIAVLAITAGALTVLWRTGSRTATFAVGIALGLSLAIRFVATRPSARDMGLLLVRPRMAAALFAVAVAAVLSGEAIADQFSRFVQKRDSFYGTSAGIWSSREHMVRGQWQRFTESPVFGNGFGVESGGPTRRPVRDATTGLALSAATEKGFLPTAILEETGLAGALLVCLAVGSLYLRIVRVAALPRLWLALTAGLVNLGESVFFSFGGVGMFLWLMLGLATLPELDAEPRQQHREGLPEGRARPDFRLARTAAGSQ